MSDNAAEIDLIRLAVKGDPNAQKAFLYLHQEVLLRYLRRHIPDDLRRQIDPLDVLQDVWLEAFRRMSTFTADDPRMAVRWLLTIARNRIIDFVRKHQSAKQGGGRQTNLDSDESIGEDSVVRLLQELAVYKRTPSKSAMMHELLVTLERSLDRLPEDHRLAIRLRYLEGLRVDEMAKRMGRSKGAVLMLCNRALKALRMELHSFSRYM